jgi:hypothetical protein
MRLVIVGMVIRSEYILKEGSSSPLNFEAYRRDPDASWHQYLSCIRSSSQEEEGHLEVKVRLLPDSRVAIEHDHHVMFGSGTPFNIRKRRLQMEKDIVYEAPPQKKSNTLVAESLTHAGNSVFEALGFSEYLHCFILRCLRSYLLGILQAPLSAKQSRLLFNPSQDGCAQRGQAGCYTTHYLSFAWNRASGVPLKSRSGKGKPESVNSYDDDPPDSAPG